MPPGLRRLESADTAYMNRVVKRKNMLDHHTYGIIPLADCGATPRTPPLPVPLGRLRCGGPPAPAGAGLTDHDEQLLDERCERIIADLVPAGVNAWRLDTAALMGLWYRLLHPRGALLQPLPPLPETPLAPPTISFAPPTEEQT